ncbi:MAG: NUDIX domain-containing protein, partial [Halanaerobiaceae bacterium]
MYKYNFCPTCGDKLNEDKIDGHMRKHCRKCNFVHYINPKPAVGIVAVKDEKILLIKRGVDPGKGTWSLPSGFIEIDESAEEACLRELKEETGLTGEVRELLGVFTEDAEIYGPVILVIYLVDSLRGEMKASDDAVGAKFVDFDDVGEFGFFCFNNACECAFEFL